jgi:hypothetical protein
VIFVRFYVIFEAHKDFGQFWNKKDKDPMQNAHFGVENKEKFIFGS